MEGNNVRDRNGQNVENNASTLKSLDHCFLGGGARTPKFYIKSRPILSYNYNFFISSITHYLQERGFVLNALPNILPHLLIIS